MKEKTVDLLDALADKIHEKFMDLYEKGEFASFSKALEEIAKDLDERYSLSFGVQLSIFDSEREESIKFLDTAVDCIGGEHPYIASGESTLHKYVVDGEIKKVPHDYCPNCWSEWDFKIDNPECPGCGYVLGEDVKILLDTDVCPHCEDGKVTMSKPVCDNCGFKVSSDIVEWG